VDWVDHVLRRPYDVLHMRPQRFINVKFYWLLDRRIRLIWSFHGGKIMRRIVALTDHRFKNQKFQRLQITSIPQRQTTVSRM